MAEIIHHKERGSDIFLTDADAIGIAVNTVEGVAGVGQAASARQKYPGWFTRYQDWCKIPGIAEASAPLQYNTELRVTARPYVESNKLTRQNWPPVTSQNKYVVLMSVPTKASYRETSSIELIEQSLARLWQTLTHYHIAHKNGLYEHFVAIESIALPALGCGAGRLDWERQVRPLMERTCGSTYFPVSKVHLYWPETWR